MNIWQIQQDLLDIFDELEENGGELTEELENKLAITQEEFKNKVTNYLNVVKQLESDVNACDAEVKRLNTIKKNKQNTIDRLKSIVALAIDKFGDENKNGNRFIDLGTSKVTVRTSDKVVVNDDYVSSFIDSTFTEIRSVAYSRELRTNTIKDLITVPENKLEGITATISVDVPLKDLYNEKGDSFIKSVFEYGRNFKTKPNVSKTELKSTLVDNPEACPEVAHLEKSKTIIIK